MALLENVSLALVARLAALGAGALVLSACPAEPEGDESGFGPSAAQAYVACEGTRMTAHLRGRGLSAYEGAPVLAGHIGGFYRLAMPSDMKPTCDPALHRTVVSDGAFDLEMPVPDHADGRVELFLDVDRDGALDLDEPHWGEGDSPYEDAWRYNGVWAQRWTLGPAEFERLRHVEISVEGLPEGYNQMLTAFDACGFDVRPGAPPCTMYREPMLDYLDSTPFHRLLRYDATATATFEAVIPQVAFNEQLPELHFLGPIGAPYCEVGPTLARCRLTKDDFAPAPNAP